MKNVFFLLVAIFTISCSIQEIDETTSSQSQVKTTELRGDGDCRECQYIQVTSEFKGAGDNCCYYKVYVKGIHPCEGGGRQSVYINNVFYGYVTNNMEIDIAVCSGASKTVRIMGWDGNDWKAECYKATFNSNAC